MRYIRKCKCVMALLLIMAVMASPWMSADTFAGIKDATVFEDVSWTYQGETAVISASGWLQSMCSTPNYIVCLENSSNTSSEPDTLLAFYRNDTDEQGQPVERYSLAKSVTERDYEHGNGMTYNSATNEILIVGSTPLNEENRGLIYIVDADTLKYKSCVKLSANYKLLGIAYSEEQHCYIVQYFNDDYTESFFVKVDATTFQQVGDTFGARMWNDIRHQDFCVSGDYLISLAFTNNVKNSNEMHIYDLETGELMAAYDLNINQSGEFIEPESICELAPGEILIANALNNPRRIALYSTTVAAAFKMTTSVENGEITGSQKTVDYGSDYTVNYVPYEDYELESVEVDGEMLDINEYPESYVFASISKNHTINVKFKEKPTFEITTSVENGTIDASVIKHRDNDVTINYAPDEHYEISELLVNGLPVSVAGNESSYTIENIQEAYSIQVRFKEIPSFEIRTEVIHGRITETASKVYRDESHAVYYSPENEDYKMAWIEVDGQRTYADKLREEWCDYLFDNVQQAHTIKVVYYWKFLPVCALFAVIVIIVFFITLIRMLPGQVRRRRLRRLYKKRRKIKKMLEDGSYERHMQKQREKDQKKREKRAASNHKKYAKRAEKNRAKAMERIAEKKANAQLFENEE